MKILSQEDRTLPNSHLWVGFAVHLTLSATLCIFIPADHTLHGQLISPALDVVLAMPIKGVLQCLF